MSRSALAQPDLPLETKNEQRLWRVAVLGLILTLLLILPGGRDMFRTPKDAAFRAVGIILLGIAAFRYLTAERSRHLNWRNPATALAVAILIWLAITTVASANFNYSVETLVTVICGIAYFAVIVSTAQFHRIGALFFVVVPALMNVALVLMQKTRIWNQFQFSSKPHLNLTGFLGNPNDVGMLLALTALTAVTAAAVMHGQRRWAWFGIAGALVIGLLVSQTLTAILALVAAVAILAIRLSPRKAGILALPAMLIFVLVVLAYPPLLMRVGYVVYSAKQGQYDLLLTRRLGAFLAAADMATEHPLTGVGPGTFGWHYFDYKLRVDQEHPGLVYRPKDARDWTYNFGEVHNDHLEILAETGIPGYFLFLASLVTLASGSFIRRDSTHPLSHGRKLCYDFGRLLSLPLAVLIFLLSLGQFPLQLAATTMVILFLSAIAYGWSRHELA